MIPPIHTRGGARYDVLSNAVVPGIFSDGDALRFACASPDGAMLSYIHPTVICPGPEDGSGIFMGGGRHLHELKLHGRVLLDSARGETGNDKKSPDR